MIQKAKRLCSAILSLCLIICFVADIPVLAEEPEEELELPSEIEGKPVTRIGAGTFVECSSMTEISLPSELTSIEVEEGSEIYSSREGILYNKEATELIDCLAGKVEVIIPENVTAIGDYAFENCHFPKRDHKYWRLGIW